jgi:predicted  nucleic acid-binding Zn-ribbon protein
MDMEDRIVVLERDVDAIKSELAVIRLDRPNAAGLETRVSRIEIDLVVIKSGISQLQKDVSQLQKDVAKLTEEVVAIRIEMMRMNTEHSHYATKADFYAVKADVKSLEAKMKGWMLAITLSIMTSVFAMIYPLYGLLKTAPVVKPAQAQQVVPLANSAPASLK